MCRCAASRQADSTISSPLQHTIFGEVAEGLEVLDAIDAAPCDDDGRPLQNIRIRHTIVLDDPTPDPPGLEAHIPDASPLPKVWLGHQTGGRAGARRGAAVGIKGGWRCTAIWSHLCASVCGRRAAGGRLGGKRGDTGP